MILLRRCMQQGHVNDPTELARSLLLGRGLIDLLLRTFSPPRSAHNETCALPSDEHR